MNPPTRRSKPKKAKAQAEQPAPAPAGSKNAPDAAKKPGWFSRFVNSRGFQTFLKALGTELIRNMFGGSTQTPSVAQPPPIFL